MGANISRPVHQDQPLLPLTPSAAQVALPCFEVMCESLVVPTVRMQALPHDFAEAPPVVAMEDTTLHTLVMTPASSLSLPTGRMNMPEACPTRDTYRTGVDALDSMLACFDKVAECRHYLLVDTTASPTAYEVRHILCIKSKVERIQLPSSPSPASSP